MKLKDKVAVVTGAAQGIGRATALMMGREGAKLVVADLQGEKAQSVANELQALGAEAIGVAVNVADETSVKQMAKATFERFGRVDILVNIAGIYFPKESVVDLTRRRLGPHHQHQSRQQFSLLPRIRPGHARAKKRADY